MKNTVGLILISLIAITSTALAADKMEQRYVKFDKDKDGFISKKEYLAMHASWGNKSKQVEEWFLWRDEDKDGKLNKKEFLKKNK